VNSVRNLDTPLKFKRALLSNRNEINIVPKHFINGPWKLNVTLTQLRCSASFLNNDLFKSNIVSSPKCVCGVSREDAFHFFFECSKYTDIWRDLLICVNRFRIKIDLALLTRGNQNLTYEDNCLIFKNKFISLLEVLSDSSLYKLINISSMIIVSTHNSFPPFLSLFFCSLLHV
jgi:hypothetical protein